MNAREIQQNARLSENQGPYTLYRADTHGTESIVVDHVSETFAKAAMEQLEARPHHQGYWYRIPERAAP
ncbi:MAG: hypothetical protein DI626_01155 [Micavibrio aeruginosavorus]|uniref:Uncharacterized protein n=1 Tax=Micavibrio aeruginosavorus TaxID=349221 RepID=A0A2W5A2D8_9BACT|nr:MAG: hypothetical protein DI626_01155 [Micavibrio aeruginosavorus]